jgi:hypothetical protein
VPDTMTPGSPCQFLPTEPIIIFDFRLFFYHKPLMRRTVPATEDEILLINAQ